MKRVPVWAMVALLSVAAPMVLAQPAGVTQQAASLRDAALTANDSYRFVEDLTTRFGARPAGSESERNASSWAVNELMRQGFENVRLQTFPLQIWERGEEKLEIIGPFAQSMAVTALGGSGATPPEGVEGEAALFETWQGFVDYMGDLKGKIVVILQPTPRTQTGVGYSVGAGSFRRHGPDMARERGAAGYVIRSLGTEDHRFAHTGATRWLGDEGIAALAISPPDAEQFGRILKLQREGKAGPVRLRLVSRPVFRGEGQSQNVIAEIKGSKYPDEVILIGGHIDSWDLGTGAVDDGAGMAVTYAAAKLIIDSGLRPERTIRLIFWGAEEVSQPDDKGLTGANAYAEGHELSKHVAAAESDFGADVIYALRLPVGDDPAFVKALSEVLMPLGVHIDKDPSTGGGPDTGPLNVKGVPVFNLRQNGYDYFDVHHTADDTMERIEAKKLDQNVAAWVSTVWLMANSRVRFQPTNK
ncbi:M20/M25/M40 family metallo-hydrolase [Asticcacaulis tiandongensis]|uniref:M20/M25/M40 family metallo-hydrolase n=1 Tax=Asticcacaulis tiandongensis TaxID=2565365 RepID=UPI001FE59E95|nr:M20/M25/M40 family metallo-hydrolase [Asticcacaulis tiandongensis]